ncbi:S8 family peptidase (plasmid) [Verrucomicrobiaceae bacterium 227]
MTTPNRLILAKGEQYITPITPGSGGAPKPYPRTYEEARLQVKQTLNDTLSQLSEMSGKFKLRDEEIVSVRMNPDFTAKSYDLERLVQNHTGLTNIGSRAFIQPLKNLPSKQSQKYAKKDDGDPKSRLIFLRGKHEDLKELDRQLDAAESRHTDAFKNEIRSIEAITLLTPEEKIAAFALEKDWKEGRVELVLHPSSFGKDPQLDFISDLLFGGKNHQENFRSASYENGPTFISCRLTRDQLEEISLANPLRSAQPLRFSGLTSVRAASSFPLPPPAVDGGKSRVTVGLFDGGIDSNHPYLVGHATEDEDLSIQTEPDDDCVSHGTAVAGILLYGALNGAPSDTPLSPPKVAVESFRVLPTSDPLDIDLYESIDVIENVVPRKPNIEFYNVSLGPCGPILEDNISRFTYALDLLAHRHKVGFCVAVGNDGDKGPVYGRIQAPSDMVNGLAIGAHSDATGEALAAPYSCVGPGREGAKNKPDLVAFGGCEDKPFHLLSSDYSSKALAQGTSFSAPLATTLAAQTSARVSVGNPLLSRAFLVHRARSQGLRFSDAMGHGTLSEDIDQLLTCPDNEVCILYNGEIQSTKSIKIPLLLPTDLVEAGKVEFSWTLAILPKPDPLSASDYTGICIEDKFYPHSKKFSLNPPKDQKHLKSRQLHLDDDAAEITSLQSDGWTLSKLPKSDSGNIYADERRRKLNLKWEPLVRRRNGKNAASIHEPFLVFHAIPRGNEREIVQFSTLVTMRASADVDLYQAIQTRYPALQPIQLRTEADLRIQI